MSNSATEGKSEIDQKISSSSEKSFAQIDFFCVKESARFFFFLSFYNVAVSYSRKSSWKRSQMLRQTSDRKIAAMKIVDLNEARIVVVSISRRTVTKEGKNI